jgi:hypothetical protein
MDFSDKVILNLREREREREAKQRNILSLNLMFADISKFTELFHTASKLNMHLPPSEGPLCGKLLSNS